MDKNELIDSPVSEMFFSHCAVSPLVPAAAEVMTTFHHDLMKQGIIALEKYGSALPHYRKQFAALLKTDPANISYTHTTAEAMCQIAWGYPFEPGDRIISYLHEYPSNHYPWLLQKRRGVELDLLPDHLDNGAASDEPPTAWSMDDLKRLCTPKTKMVALSHVQFTTGYAADLVELGRFCRERDIDLIVDCAQSLGCLPVYPEEFGISAVAASGWKWLMGPKGAGVLYTSERFRQKLEPIFGGPSMMKQMFDYLDHTWDPFEDGRKLEYSTIPWDHVLALSTIAERLFSHVSMEAVRDEVFRLQDLLVAHIDPDIFNFLKFEPNNRSGILTARLPENANQLVKALLDHQVVISERAGYLRFAPHFYQTDQQMIAGAETINRVCSNILK
ncbi:MAG: aminotransferase class V-fold PLP-dependent enzyme [Desulfobulbaceae bacterium]|nr:MAG: aminotransferase class V-fold PLP-dependent enzyme [Desulfobulbaceae bacterium]